MQQRGRDRTLVEYTVVSLVATIAIGALLVTVLIERVSDQSLQQHVSLLISYFDSIPTNYPELADHLAGDDGMAEHATDHFARDLFLFPSITRLRILDRDARLIWNWARPGTAIEEMHRPGLEDARSGQVAIHISTETSLEPSLHIYYPFVSAGDVMAVIEATDADPEIHATLREVRRVIVARVASAGAAIYGLLFFVFFRSYRRLTTAYQRLDTSQTVTIRSMSRLAELRDQETGDHIDRTSRYCGLLADELRKLEKYSGYITDQYTADLVRSAPLHDIGKVGIPDSVLLKPGPLDEQEWKLMKEHPILGARILEKSVSQMGFRSYFEIGLQVVMHHHENWDGTGYPDGLSGDEIPLSARIMALADVYDAVRNERPYKSAFTHEEALAIIAEEKGRKLDPTVVEAFMRVQGDFVRVSTELQSTIA
jgi:response regulator RpfG family c-di-GMP phosphodiesterase